MIRHKLTARVIFQIAIPNEIKITTCTRPPFSTCSSCSSSQSRCSPTASLAPITCPLATLTDYYGPLMTPAREEMLRMHKASIPGPPDT
jgi:hypothetical protein